MQGMSLHERSFRHPEVKEKSTPAGLMKFNNNDYKDEFTGYQMKVGLVDNDFLADRSKTNNLLELVPHK